MPAVPLVNVKVNVVSVLEATLKVIGKLMALPSLAAASPIVTTGAPVASVIVAVATIGVEPLVVVPEVTVALSVKVSLGSDKVSVVVGTFTVTDVCPAGIVTVVLTVV